MKVLKSAKSAFFRLKSADLWVFQTVFPNFRVLRETFLRFCWHISEGFGVKKNDAVVHFGLSITVQKLKKMYTQNQTGPKVHLLLL